MGAAHLSVHGLARTQGAKGQNVGTWEDWNLGLAWVRRKEKPEAGGPTEGGRLDKDSATYFEVGLAMRTGQPLPVIQNATDQEINAFLAHIEAEDNERRKTRIR